MTSGPDTRVQQKAIITLTDNALADGMCELRWQLRDLVLDGVRVVVVDVSGTDQLSSTTLAALLATHRVCRQRGGEVVIRYPDRNALDMLRRTGLDRVFRVERPDEAPVGPAPRAALRPAGAGAGRRTGR